MNTDPLYSARLKLERAERHIGDLNTEIRRFLERDPYQATIKRHHKPGYYALRYIERESIPTEIPLIIGDAAHNLRTALDHLAVALVRLAGRSTKNVYFPFADRAEDLGGVIAKRKIPRAGAKVVDVIRSFKPYKGGNRTLRGVHDLDIADKHSIIVPARRLINFPEGLTNTETGFQIAPSDILMNPENRALLRTVPIHSDLQIDQDFPITTEIVFDETITELGGLGVEEVFEEAKIQVRCLIEIFATMIQRREIP